MSFGSDTLVYNAVAVADVNGDGMPDLVSGACPNTSPIGSPANCGSPTDGSFQVQLGNGDGSFQPALFFAAGGTWPTSVAVADLNGDGRPDAVVANWYSNDGRADGQVEVLINVRPTTTSLTSSHNPALTSQAITYTATILPQPGGTVTGSVVFSVNDQTVGTAKVKGNTAKLKTSFASVGTYSVTAVYGGDANTSGSTSPPLDQVVGAASATTTTLTSSLNPSAHGQAVTLTATVSSSGIVPPTGRVKFVDGAKTIGSGILIGGVATVTKSNLKVGPHAITASYVGDKFSGASTSSVLNQVVNP